jgi:hypothetical protein
MRRKCDISARKLAEDLKLNRFVKLSAYNSATVEKRFKRAKILLSWHVGNEIIFPNEKMFVLGQQLN